mmetsp:Transcript_15303/g.18720  ORF Transcript_15303/g.18720 Transcript_15303/m.18720 type:complete len:214 (-) Transcript_15303:83-724(-)
MGIGCSLGLGCCKGKDEKMQKDEAQLIESTALGKGAGKRGEAQKNEYIKQHNLISDNCIEGIAASDQEMFEFVQQNIEKKLLECIVLISPNVAKAYKLPDQVSSQTGISMISQLILNNKDTLKIFHLNGQRLDRDRAPEIVKSLMECNNLIKIDFHDCMIDNDGGIFLFNNLKHLPNLVQVTLSANDINAETRDQIQSELEQLNQQKSLEFVF